MGVMLPNGVVFHGIPGEELVSKFTRKREGIVYLCDGISKVYPSGEDTLCYVSGVMLKKLLKFFGTNPQLTGLYGIMPEIDVSDIITWKLKRVDDKSIIGDFVISGVTRILHNLHVDTDDERIEKRYGIALSVPIGSMISLSGSRIRLGDSEHISLQGHRVVVNYGGEWDARIPGLISGLHGGDLVKMWHKSNERVKND